MENSTISTWYSVKYEVSTSKSNRSSYQINYHITLTVIVIHEKTVHIIKCSMCRPTSPILDVAIQSGAWLLRGPVCSSMSLTKQSTCSVDGCTSVSELRTDERQSSKHFKRILLVGQRWGKLMVLYREQRRNHSHYKHGAMPPEIFFKNYVKIALFCHKDVQFRRYFLIRVLVVCAV